MVKVKEYIKTRLDEFSSESQISFTYEFDEATNTHKVLAHVYDMESNDQLIDLDFELLDYVSENNIYEGFLIFDQSNKFQRIKNPEFEITSFSDSFKKNFGENFSKTIMLLEKMIEKYHKKSIDSGSFIREDFALKMNEIEESTRALKRFQNRMEDSKLNFSVFLKAELSKSIKNQIRPKVFEDSKRKPITSETVNFNIYEAA